MKPGFSTRVDNFLKRWPIETYALILLPLLALLIFLSLTGQGLGYFKEHAGTLAYYFLFGGAYFLIAFNLLNLYFVFKLLIFLGEAIISQDQSERREFYGRVKKLILGQAYLYLALVFGLLLVGILVSYLSVWADHSLVNESSRFFMEWDKAVFGVYPFFWLSQMDGSGFWSKAFLISYESLGVVLAFALVSFLAFSKKLSRRFIAFFFFAPIISFPIFFSFPALSPYNMYVRNLLKTELPQETGSVVDRFAPSPMLTNYLTGVDSAREKAGNYLDLTTMPSMHVAWGFGTMVYLVELAPILGIVAIPWFVLESFGTSYTGQHYGVDVFGGIAVAIVALFLVELLFRLEKKYYKKGEFMPISDFIREDVNFLLGFWRKLCGHVVGWHKRWAKTSWKI